ncbi:MAG TPA: hypothetical protein VF054_00535 [Micromonosporaceae bacterium]
MSSRGRNDDFPVAELARAVDRAVQTARNRIAVTVEASGRTFSATAMDGRVRAEASAGGVLARLDVDPVVWRRAAVDHAAAATAQEAILCAVNDALRAAHAAARGRGDDERSYHADLVEIGRGFDRALEQISHDLARATSWPSR